MHEAHRCAQKFQKCVGELLRRRASFSSKKKKDNKVKTRKEGKATSVLNQVNADYASMVYAMDENVGRLIASLKENDLYDDALIIFSSDNGPFGGVGDASPLRADKGHLYEGGIRVPASISWPGKIPANQFRDQMSVNVDWMPTLIELCGFDTDTSDMDGQSLMPIIKNKMATSNDEEG